MSSDGATSLTPAIVIVPNVGLKPKMPQKLAGRMTEPAVWVPSATSTMPVATAAAEPLDDPPGVCVTRCGFVVGPGSNHRELGGDGLAQCDGTGGAELRDDAGVGHAVGVLRRSADPYSVGWSPVSKMSFTPSTTPDRGPVADRASSRARSGSRNAQA